MSGSPIQTLDYQKQASQEIGWTSWNLIIKPHQFSSSSSILIIIKPYHHQTSSILILIINPLNPHHQTLSSWIIRKPAHPLASRANVTQGDYLQRENKALQQWWHPTISSIGIIFIMIINRPKLAYGRQGLAGGIVGSGYSSSGYI